jgi:hypothetical protein
MTNEITNATTLLADRIQFWLYDVLMPIICVPGLVTCLMSTYRGHMGLFGPILH